MSLPLQPVGVCGDDAQQQTLACVNILGRRRSSTEHTDAKVGSLPHGCVHCRGRPQSIHLQEAAAARPRTSTLERRCARLSSDLRHSSTGSNSFVVQLASGEDTETVDAI